MNLLISRNNIDTDPTMAPIKPIEKYIKSVQIFSLSTLLS